ncbi:phosphorylase [Novosphingobium sp. G106]|uniref:phosphorylase family protein n=1 Tax=Novosphingobium sp. G106 TaxID=2849500 RepID=UPI001C2D54F8|nr:phosphorylase [Novosphingobium sp. G106]MBV1688652.1 phosphorylase [Novosphingobium sp. G106]
MKPVIVVTGLEREGAVLCSEGIQVLAGGGTPARLAAELARAAPGATGIISFGMAGALDSTLKLGQWVIGDRLTGVFDQTCDPRWVRALAQALPGARIGAAYCDGRLIADPAEKQALGAGYDALSADMESHVAAQAAASAGLPFAVLRCISDEAGARLPPAIAVAMRPDGGLALGAVLGSILAQPGQLPALLGSVRGFARAYAALRAGARAAGPRLAFDLR